MSKLFYRLFLYRWKRKYRKKAGYPRKWWKYPHESVDEWGTIWKSSGTESDDITKGHPSFGPLQESWEMLEDCTIPDASLEERFRIAKTWLWKRLGKNKYTVGELAPNGFFALCSQLRGFSNFLVDLARKPEQVTKLIDKILPYFLTLIKKYKEYHPPLNSVIIADDMGTQKSPFMSPEIFRRFFKEPYKKLVDLTHELEMDFILHSCGQIHELMPEIVDIGVDVFEFDSPRMVGIENIQKYAKERKVAFWLSSNIQSTFALGTSNEVKEEIKTYIKDVGNNNGGLAIYEYMPSSTLNAPKENVIAQREATLKWGRYDDQGKIKWGNN
jgi:uroporphyrinogen decarboxylase